MDEDTVSIGRTDSRGVSSGGESFPHINEDVSRLMRDEQGVISAKLARAICATAFTIIMGLIAMMLIRGPLSDWLEGQLHVVGSPAERVSSASVPTQEHASILP